MHVCFISLEYFGWGRYGGIGKATMDIAQGLNKRGLEVSVVVPLSHGQMSYEYVNNVNVYGFPLKSYPLIGSLLRRIGADIYHSQDPTLGTWLAKRYCKKSLHLLTCQNPKSEDDWKYVAQYYPFRRRVYNAIIDPRVKKCIKELDCVFCQAKYIIKKTRELYNLEYDPIFLPNPVKVPGAIPCKSKTPTILFLGRFDKEKKPEAFMSLAEQFPDVKFIAAGASHNLSYDKQIRSRYSSVKNLFLPGFVDGTEKLNLLTKSWILINTSVSECLPISFLEASSHGCAILSPHDPDEFASKFGIQVTKDKMFDGLTWLLDNDNWREKGIEGYKYVKKIHDEAKVIDAHLIAYEEIG
jgi:glycosyltransferase involved in cell wall biosynthesis